MSQSHKVTKSQFYFLIIRRILNHIKSEMLRNINVAQGNKMDSIQKANTGVDDCIFHNWVFRKISPVCHPNYLEIGNRPMNEGQGLAIGEPKKLTAVNNSSQTACTLFRSFAIFFVNLHCQHSQKRYVGTRTRLGQCTPKKRTRRDTTEQRLKS